MKAIVELRLSKGGRFGRTDVSERREFTPRFCLDPSGFTQIGVFKFVDYLNKYDGRLFKRIKDQEKECNSIEFQVGLTELFLKHTTDPAEHIKAKLDTLHSKPEPEELINIFARALVEIYNQVIAKIYSDLSPSEQSLIDFHLLKVIWRPR